MKKTTQMLSELLLDAINTFYENDRQAKNFGTDTTLYHSEIHMLQCIEENPGLHIAGIARLLGITRGAASQTAKRLVHKRMIVKRNSPEDNKKIVLQLTAKGKTAVGNHKSAHEKYDGMIADILADAGPEQLLFLRTFLTRWKDAIQEK